MRRIVRLILLGFFAAALAAGVWFTLAYVLDPRHFARYEEMELRLDRLRGRNLSLERDNRRLIREIEAVQRDPRYLDDLARHNLNLIRDGEVVYLFPR